MPGSAGPNESIAHPSHACREAAREGAGCGQSASLDHGAVLHRFSQEVKTRFSTERRILSFEEYLALVVRDPWRFTRDAARYLRDCIAHFGTMEVQRAWGPERRWRVFDADEGRDARHLRPGEHLVGHEDVQERLVQILDGFVGEGRSDRLVLFHGPNGSAKTTLVACLLRALERYSQLDEGVLYAFSWVFPRGEGSKGIGFGSGAETTGDLSSFAHLDDERLQAKVRSELREHPLLLLPTAQRRALLREAYASHGIEREPPSLLWSGALSQKNRMIFDALLASHQGDLARVLAHVQVERVSISRRYRRGAVTIGPQMAVDAQERQVTMTTSMANLPASLSSLTLFEPQGELVDGSGGIIEYSDLLKRPLDAWKYLLIAVETGEVALQLSNLALNSVLLGSSNELHLAAFREHHEFHSFRGRMTLVCMPYLVDYRQEQAIYDAQVVPQLGCHVAPHSTYVASLWAVLTRLRRADPSAYEDGALGEAAAALSPLAKAELYAEGKTPDGLPLERAQLLRRGIKPIFQEGRRHAAYEGLSGVSPRELRALIVEASQAQEATFVSPVGVLEAIARFCQRKDFDFLDQRPDAGYQDHRGFLVTVRRRWLDRVDEELRRAAGLVDEGRYRDLFVRYVMHVSNWVKGEGETNKLTGKQERPDERLMAEVESTLGVGEDADSFRRQMISTVAAYAIAHPGDQVDYEAAFPRYVQQLRNAYYRDQGKKVGAYLRAALALLAQEPVRDIETRASGQAIAEAFTSRFGYTEASARQALSELLQDRYRLS